MNILKDLQQAIFDYEDTWGKVPDLLFINRRDYYKSISNISNVFNSHIPDMFAINQKRTFQGCEVFWLNNSTAKPFYFYEKFDIEKAIQSERGYLRQGLKIHKIKLPKIEYFKGSEKATENGPLPKDFILVDELAAMAYIKTKGDNYIRDLIRGKRYS